MEIESLALNGIVASEKLQIETSVNDFIFDNALFLDTVNQWQLIEHLAVITPKIDLGYDVMELS